MPWCVGKRTLWMEISLSVYHGGAEWQSRLAVNYYRRRFFNASRRLVLRNAFRKHLLENEESSYSVWLWWRLPFSDGCCLQELLVLSVCLVRDSPTGGNITGKNCCRGMTRLWLPFSTDFATNVGNFTAKEKVPASFVNRREPSMFSVLAWSHSDSALPCPAPAHLGFHICPEQWLLL